MLYECTLLHMNLFNLLKYIIDDRAWAFEGWFWLICFTLTNLTVVRVDSVLTSKHSKATMAVFVIFHHLVGGFNPYEKY